MEVSSKCEYCLVVSPKNQQLTVNYLYKQRETIQNCILIYPTIFLLVWSDFMLCLERAYSQCSLINTKQRADALHLWCPSDSQFFTMSSLATSEYDCLLPLFMKLSYSCVSCFIKLLSPTSFEKPKIYYNIFNVLEIIMC